MERKYEFNKVVISAVIDIQAMCCANQKALAKILAKQNGTTKEEELEIIKMQTDDERNLLMQIHSE